MTKGLVKDEYRWEMENIGLRRRDKTNSESLNDPEFYKS